mgnify:CR=1 FL=1
MAKIHNFKDSLKYGNKKEAEFCKLFPELELLDGYIADMKIRSNGKTIDLKSDRYDLNKTGNFFMERYSYADKNGGVWQAADKNIDYYVYQFTKNNLIYVFKTWRLLKLMEENEGLFKQIKVYNTSHVTVGYLVPRELLEPIAMTMEDILK